MTAADEERAACVQLPRELVEVFRPEAAYIRNTLGKQRVQQFLRKLRRFIKK